MLKIKFFDVDCDPVTDASRAAFFSFECSKHPGRWHEFLAIAGRVSEPRDPQGQNGGIPQWDWGNAPEMVRPTFSPSVHCKGCCHGYIELGEWTKDQP